MLWEEDPIKNKTLHGNVFCINIRLFFWQSLETIENMFYKHVYYYENYYSLEIKFMSRGWLIDFSVKSFKTANWFKNPIKVALFTISCISFIFRIGIGSFCTNFIKIYPSQKIDHLPHLRIHLLYRDYPVQTWINSLCLFLLFLFMPIADVMHRSMH